MIIKSFGPKPGKVKSANAHIAHQIRYCAKQKELGVENELHPLLTNCAGASSDELTQEFQNLATLRPDLKNPTRHIVLSPEIGDRILTPDEWQKAVDVYRERRGLGDAPYVAYLHTDGNEKRHPHHLHVFFLRIKSDGSTVPDSLDSNVHRDASRQIERDLGLVVNAGADKKDQFNGRNKHVQRELAAERRGDSQERVHVNPDAVSRAIDQSRNVRELRSNLKAEGIEMRVRKHNDGQVYGWSLRNIDGPKEWTSGTKLTASNEFGWHKVQSRLDQNFAERLPMPAGRRHPTRMRGLKATQRPQLPHRRIDEAADKGMAEALALAQQLMSIMADKRPSTATQSTEQTPTKAQQPTARRRPDASKPKPAVTQRTTQRSRP